MSEVRVKWGGFCGSDPKYGKVVGYAQDLRTHEPLVLVVEDGVISKTRSLPEREVEVVGGEYPPEFVEAIATWTAGKPGPVQGGAAVTLHLDKDQAQALVEVLSAVGGDPRTTARRHTAVIYNRLRDAGFVFTSVDSPKFPLRNLAFGSVGVAFKTEEELNAVDEDSEVDEDGGCW